MQVPSELIVVTTGTDVRIREIVSGYTDQIVPFTWCDDFSAARNAGMLFGYQFFFDLLHIHNDVHSSRILWLGNIM